MRSQTLKSRVGLAAAALLLGVTAPASSIGQSHAGGEWVLPRTAWGDPDLQGNWTNATLTPIQRPPGMEPTLTPAQVAEMEGRQAEQFAEDALPSDPDREAPPVGGISTGDPLLDSASGGTGGYNTFYIDPGDRVAVWNGEARSSLVIDPPDGRIPPLTSEAQRTVAAAAARQAEIGQYANPENRPLGERCILGFGSNAGPPMMPNYFYNNNYTIVQTEDEVMVMTEMVHDVRIIRLGEPQRLPDHIRPWMGDSWGRWEGDTLIVETTNMPLQQVNGTGYIHSGGSEDFTVIERFTRVDEDTINYEFTVEDPTWYTAPWGGQVPFERMNALVYEYACHEANYSLFNVLSGARAQERREAEEAGEAQQ